MDSGWEVAADWASAAAEEKAGGEGWGREAVVDLGCEEVAADSGWEAVAAADSVAEEGWEQEAAMGWSSAAAEEAMGLGLAEWEDWALEGDSTQAGWGTAEVAGWGSGAVAGLGLAAQLDPCSAAVAGAVSLRR